MWIVPKMAGRKFVIFFTFLSVVLSVTGYSVKNTDEVSLSSYSNEKVQEQYLEKKDSPPLYYMNQYCGQTLVLNSRNAIRVSPWNTGYPPSSVSCGIHIKNQNHPTYDLGVTFKKVLMSARSGQTCSKSRLDLYNGITTVFPISDNGGICGTSAKREQYDTTTSVLTMTYTTNNLPKSYQTFEAVITPFHYGKCAYDEFKCANRKCVKNNMLCDHYDNCGDNSDEKNCKGLLLSIAAIIGIVIGGVILVAILTTIICCCCCCTQFGYERF